MRYFSRWLRRHCMRTNQLVVMLPSGRTVALRFRIPRIAGLWEIFAKLDDERSRIAETVEPRFNETHAARRGCVARYRPEAGNFAAIYSLQCNAPGGTPWLQRMKRKASINRSLRVRALRAPRAWLVVKLRAQCR